MYPSYDMNPIAIEHMRREHLKADAERVDRDTEMRFHFGIAVIVVLVALGIVI